MIDFNTSAYTQIIENLFFPKMETNINRSHAPSAIWTALLPMPPLQSLTILVTPEYKKPLMNYTGMQNIVYSEA